MRPEEIRKLIGGYATGTLSEAERQALFTAALDDQELFNELAGEESLRRLLSDPGARAEMLAAVAARPRGWAWWRPAVAALAIATIGAVIVLLPRKKPAPTAVAPPPAIVAEVKPAPPPPRPAPPKRAVRRAPASAPKAVPRGVVGGAPGGVAGGLMPPQPAAPLAAPTFRNSFATAESVQLTTATLSARTLFFLVRPTGFRLQAGGTEPPQFLGIRYRVARDDAGAVTLQITANANGFVSVAEGEPVALTAMRPYTTPALNGAEARVVFARTPEKALTGPVAVLTETAGGDVYVVTSAPGGAELGFTVPLSQQ